VELGVDVRFAAFERAPFKTRFPNSKFLLVRNKGKKSEIRCETR
jgi:hypothetical protein